MTHEISVKVIPVTEEDADIEDTDTVESK
jgi:hypothetical protein